MKHEKYHWFNKYTGELDTTIGMIKTIIWTFKHPKVYPNLNVFKYIFSWHYSIYAY